LEHPRIILQVTESETLEFVGITFCFFCILSLVMLSGGAVYGEILKSRLALEACHDFDKQFTKQGLRESNG